MFYIENYIVLMYIFNVSVFNIVINNINLVKCCMLVVKVCF